MKSSIIALTEADDTHLELVQLYLDKDVLVISPRAAIDGNELSLEILHSGRTRVSFKGKEVHAKSIWFRKPKPYKPEDLPVADNFRTYVNELQQYHYRLLRDAFPEAVWVSDVYAIQRMNSKYLQLQLAKQSGFRIPRTLFTSSDTRARDFVRQSDTCVVKVESSHFPDIDGKHTFFLARKITKNDTHIIKGLDVAPAIFQECVDAAYDVRVAVVGTKTFGSSIMNDGPSVENIRDWRVGHFKNTIRFEPITLPKDIANKCVEFTRRAGLMFGAFDFVVDKKGGYWFIEDNPNGQWAFVEESTRTKIAQAMAALLT